MSAKLLKKKAEKSKKVIAKNIVKFDPTDLEKAHYLPEDEKIKALDIPERFQLRKTPVEPFKNDEEANEEANWIWSQVFQNKGNHHITRSPVVSFERLSLNMEMHRNLKCGKLKRKKLGFNLSGALF